MTQSLPHPAQAAFSNVCRTFVPGNGTDQIWREPKSSVFRFMHGSASIIAKQCLAGIGEIERTVYETVLPTIGVASVRYYGFTEDGDRVWLFMENSGGRQYLPESSAQRAAAAGWVARLHTGGCALRNTGAFEDRSAAAYLDQLRSARVSILDHRDDASLSAGHRDMLAQAARSLSEVENFWNHFAGACEDLPATFVHGDLQPKNLHVHGEAPAIRVMPLDWEHSGWGTPAVDLAYVDAAEYLACVQHHWPAVTLDMVTRLSRIGRLFQALAAIYWGASSLPEDSGLIDVEYYSVRLRGMCDEIFDCKC